MPRLFRFFLILLPLLASPFPALCAERKISFQPLLQESLAYDISFLGFDRLAEGRLNFTAGEVPGTYRAVLEARTQGLASRLSGNRGQRYVSIMETGPDGRLRALSHEAHLLKGREGREVRTKRYLYDYARGQVLYQRVKQGRLTHEETVSFDEKNPPADMLTALYNFRAGVYGMPEPGERVVIPAFSHKGVSDIVVEMLTAEQRRGLPFPEQGRVCRVMLDPEIFDTGGGQVFVWFNGEGQPVGGIVENVLGVGDVRGAIR